MEQLNRVELRGKVANITFSLTNRGALIFLDTIAYRDGYEPQKTRHIVSLEENSRATLKDIKKVQPGDWLYVKGYLGSVIMQGCGSGCQNVCGVVAEIFQRLDQEKIQPEHADEKFVGTVVCPGCDNNFDYCPLDVKSCEEICDGHEMPHILHFYDYVVCPKCGQKVRVRKKEEK